MPLITDYADVDQLKAFMRIPDAVDDAELGLAITAASRAIDYQTRRAFGRVDAPQQMLYGPVWSAFACEWQVAMDDLHDATGLLVEVGGQELPDWELGPANAHAHGRPWTLLRILSGYTDGPVTVSSPSFGWTEVPDAVTLACLLQASRFHNRRNSPYGVAGSPEMGNELRLLARLDPDVAVTLAAYTRTRRVVG